MNWGKGIALGIIGFMAFILSFVYRAFQHDSELVREDYYEHEIKFDENKKSKTNYQRLQKDIEIVQKEEGICFEFPEEIGHSVNGQIQFYRPDAKKYDRVFPLEIDQNRQQWLSYDEFRVGYYDITVEWENENAHYIFEDHIQF